MCQMHTISKDQVLRLRVVWGLPPRNDRRLRHKPDAARDPTTTEIQISCLAIQATWNDNTREARRVIKTRRATVRILDVPEDLRDAIEADDE